MTYTIYYVLKNQKADQKTFTSSEDISTALNTFINKQSFNIKDLYQISIRDLTNGILS